MLASVDPDPVCDRQDHSCLVRTRSWQEEYHAVSSQKNPTESTTEVGMERETLVCRIFFT